MADRARKLRLCRDGRRVKWSKGLAIRLVESHYLKHGYLEVPLALPDSFESVISNFWPLKHF